MTTTLALFEGGSLVAALYVVLVWQAPAAGGWTQVARALGLALSLALCAVVALYYGDAYNLRSVHGLGRFAARLPRCLVLAGVALGACYVLLPASRVAVIATVVLMIGLLPALRLLFYGLVRSRAFAQRMLIIGTGPLAHRAVEAIEQEGGGRYAIVGVVEDPTLDGEPIAGYPRLESLARLDEHIDAARPDRIVVALEDRRRRLPVRALLEARLRGIVVEEGVHLYERLTGKIAIEWLTPSCLIFCPDYFRMPRLALATGRALSLLVAVLGLIALAPVTAVIALAIRLDSPGPVLFVQERVGQGGRRFRLLKFRTMRDVEQHPSEWAGDNGHRITRVGRWLRRFRLDEFPQLVNILRGDMDLVGPRPHPACNFSLLVTVLRNSPECGEQIPYYSLRAMMRPGLTGWAQVRYRYANNLEEEIEKMRYDLYYLKHRSLWLDLRILADTVKTVVTGRESQEADTAPGAAPARARWQLAAKPR